MSKIPLHEIKIPFIVQVLLGVISAMWVILTGIGGWWANWVSTSIGQLSIDQAKISTKLDDIDNHVSRPVFTSMGDYSLSTTTYENKESFNLPSQH